MENRNILLIALVTALILLVPFMAMQFTEEIAWDLFDFVIAGVLVFGTGLAYELVARKGRTFSYRSAMGIALVAALLLVWINLAVGIIGSEDNSVNLMYFGVLAIGVLGTFSARLRPNGMARTLFAMALAQAMVTVIALIFGEPEVTSVEAYLHVMKILVVNAFFIILFVGSAVLFRRASASWKKPVN